MTHELKRQTRAAVAELLELTATSRPELLEFQLDALLNSPVRYAVRDLAATLGVPHQKVAFTVYRSCQDLDRLLTIRRMWSDPNQILEAPNVPALYHVCLARLGRTSGPGRGRLEITLKRLSRAHQLLQNRRWIEAFIGPPLPTTESKRQSRNR